MRGAVGATRTRGRGAGRDRRGSAAARLCVVFSLTCAPPRRSADRALAHRPLAAVSDERCSRDPEPPPRAKHGAEKLYKTREAVQFLRCSRDPGPAPRAAAAEALPRLRPAATRPSRAARRRPSGRLVTRRPARGPRPAAKRLPTAGMRRLRRGGLDTPPGHVVHGMSRTACRALHVVHGMSCTACFPRPGQESPACPRTEAGPAPQGGRRTGTPAQDQFSCPYLFMAPRLTEDGRRAPRAPRRVRPRRTSESNCGGQGRRPGPCDSDIGGSLGRTSGQRERERERCGLRGEGGKKGERRECERGQQEPRPRPSTSPTWPGGPGQKTAVSPPCLRHRICSVSATSCGVSLP